MPYTDMWEIQDDNGTIHSGTEEEMRNAFMTMTNQFPDDYSVSQIRQLQHEYDCEYSGDLKLVQIHDTYK
jgi:hypothetical protein